MRTLKSNVRRIIPLLLLLCLLSSCALHPQAPPDYRQRSFDAELSWQLGDIHLAGTLSVRDASPQVLELTSPETLRGIRIVWTEGTPRAECHGLTTDADPLATLWETATWLTLTGNITPVCLTRDETPLLYATLQDPSSSSPYEFYLNPESGIPQSIRQEDRQLTVHRFTFTSETEKDRS